jgi:hypothetical protein
LREALAAIAAVVIVLIMAGVGAAMAGWNIPILTNFIKMIIGQ